MSHISWRGTWRGLSPDGLSHQRAREVLRSTGGIIRGKFPSRKTGRMVHYEGLLELDALYHFETSPLIVSYTEQPVRIHYPDGARLRRYTPDFQLHLADGQDVLIEVKPAANAVRPETCHALTQISAHFNRTAQAFELLTDEALRIEPRLSNLKVIHHAAARIRPELLRGEALRQSSMLAAWNWLQRQQRKHLTQVPPPRSETSMTVYSGKSKPRTNNGYQPIKFPRRRCAPCTA